MEKFDHLDQWRHLGNKIHPKTDDIILISKFDLIPNGQNGFNISQGLIYCDSHLWKTLLFVHLWEISPKSEISMSAILEILLRVSNSFKKSEKKNQVGLENLHQLTTSLYYRLNIRDSPNIPSYGRSRNNRYPYTTRKLDLFHNCFSGGHSYHYTEIHSLYGNFSSCESAMLWRGVSLILVTK